MNRETEVYNFGTIEYASTWEFQRTLQTSLIDAKRANPKYFLPHKLLLVEHPPVFTLGKSGLEEHLLASETILKEKNATFFKIDRGGDITFHGPGQIVGYPILDLDYFFTDVGKYLRLLEEVIIQVCATYQLSTTRIEGKTGVWIPKDTKGIDRKICAMGIRCSRWVTMHGFAFNVNTDLSYFDLIVPCGIANAAVTSLQKELGRKIDEHEVRERIVHYFELLFESSMKMIPHHEIRRLEKQLSLSSLEK